MDKEKYYELLSYIISSAYNCVKEPKIYGPLRLIETAERLIRLLDEDAIVENGALLKLAEKIEDKKLLCMSDEEGFYGMLAEASSDMADVVIDL